jgi:hypothetical protein
VKHGEKVSYLGHILRQVIPAWSVVRDEEESKKHFIQFGPGELCSL